APPRGGGFRGESRRDREERSFRPASWEGSAGGRRRGVPSVGEGGALRPDGANKGQAGSRGSFARPPASGARVIKMIRGPRGGWGAKPWRRCAPDVKAGTCG